MGLRTPRPAKQAATKAFCAFGLVSFTIGAEAANVINVAVQLKDALGVAVAQRVVATIYLSDSSVGAGLTATVPTSSNAIGTNGVLLGSLTTDKAQVVLSDASGRFDLNITQTATPTYYLVVVMPDGSISVSGAITFA